MRTTNSDRWLAKCTAAQPLHHCTNSLHHSPLQAVRHSTTPLHHTPHYTLHHCTTPTTPLLNHSNTPLHCTTAHIHLRVPVRKARGALRARAPSSLHRARGGARLRGRRLLCGAAPRSRTPRRRTRFGRRAIEVEVPWYWGEGRGGRRGEWEGEEFGEVGGARWGWRDGWLGVGACTCASGRLR